MEERRFFENRNTDNTRKNNWDSSQQRYPQRNNYIVSSKLFVMI